MNGRNINDKDRDILQYLNAKSVCLYSLMLDRVIEKLKRESMVS